MPRPRDQNPAKLALAIGRLEEWKHTPGLGHVMHGNTDNEEYFMTNTFNLNSCVGFDEDIKTSGDDSFIHLGFV